MAVPFYDHRKLYARRKAEIDQAIFRVIESGRLDWGDEVPAFEAELAAWVDAAHAVTTNSGSVSLQIALLALGIGRGDEVITVTNTDIGTISAIHCTGADSVFVDVDPATLCMDLAAVRAAIGPRTRAILPVDMFGQPAALLELGNLARSKGLVMVEDACLALGAEIAGRRVGSFSDVTCFSFAPTKHLGSFGSGGACVTEDSALAERMRKIAAYGQDRARHCQIERSPPPLHHETEGLNARLDEIQAAILRVKLPDVEESLAVRRHQAARYSAAFADIVEVPREAPGTCHAWRNYVVHLDRRDQVREGLTARGIGSALSYAPPQHLQPVYAHKGFSRGAFPVSERSGDRLLGLPIGPHHDDAAIDEIAEGLRESIRALA